RSVPLDLLVQPAARRRARQQLSPGEINDVPLRRWDDVLGGFLDSVGRAWISRPAVMWPGASEVRNVDCVVRRRGELADVVDAYAELTDGLRSAGHGRVQHGRVVGDDQRAGSTVPGAQAQPDRDGRVWREGADLRRDGADRADGEWLCVGAI